jgi:ABC-type glycerol-3-phosphate transport system permease component
LLCLAAPPAVLAAVAGVIHGYAMSESVIGASALVSAAYVGRLIIGLTALIMPMKALAHWVFGRETMFLLPARTAGGAVAALGVSSSLTGLI